MRCGILAMEVGDEMWNSGDELFGDDKKFGDEISAMQVEMSSAMWLEMSLAMTIKLWR